MSTDVVGRIAAWAGFIVRPTPTPVPDASHGPRPSVSSMGHPARMRAPGDSHDERGAESETVA